LVPGDISLIVAAIAVLAGAGFIAERWNGYRPARVRQGPTALPRAILLAYLVFAAASAPLMLSPSGALRDLGQLAAVAAGLQLLASFLIAPELLRWTRRRP